MVAMMVVVMMMPRTFRLGGCCEKQKRQGNQRDCQQALQSLQALEPIRASIFKNKRVTHNKGRHVTHEKVAS